MNRSLCRILAAVACISLSGCGDITADTPFGSADPFTDNAATQPASEKEKPVQYIDLDIDLPTAQISQQTEIPATEPITDAPVTESPADNIVVEVATLTPTEPPPLPQSDKKYVLYQDTLTWKEAEAACRELGGHLAYIKSKAEFDTIISQLDATDLKYLWIGGLSFESDGRIVTKWLDDTPTTFIDSNSLWYSGEPSGKDLTSSAKAREPYIMLWKIKDKWSFNDSSDLSLALFKKHNFGFICEIDDTQTAPEMLSVIDSIADTYLIGKVTTKVDDLSVREAPSESSERIGYVRKGEMVSISGKDGDWYIIDYNGGYGYVSASYITIQS